jgi:hypothetical protein
MITDCFFKEFFFFLVAALEFELRMFKHLNPDVQTFERYLWTFCSEYFEDGVSR